MILKKVNYYEHKGENNYWAIRNICLGDVNLIVGLNATGKTRFFNIISNLAKILTKKTNPKNGCWNLEFQPLDDRGTFIYNLAIVNGKIEKEEIIRDGKTLLQRMADDGQIWSVTQSKMTVINPPKTELILSIRRDKVEYPFLEDLYRWAESFYGFAFSMSPNEIGIPYKSDAEVLLQNLYTVPYILKEAMQNIEFKKVVIEDLRFVGYPINEVRIGTELIAGAPPGILIAELQEQDLKCSTKQMFMSSGMFRAFAIIVIIEYILQRDGYCTIAIDDFGEGLDYDRAAKLTQLLFRKAKGSKIQLLVTSNSRFLINNIDIECLNILERRGHEVESFNYFNSKEKFEDFKITGLSAFDFFSGKMYRE